MKNVKLIAGIAAGVAAGAVLGILFAPDKGKDTRKLIVRKSREFGTDMNHLMEEKLNELMLSMRGKFTPMKKTTEPVKPENANV